MTARTSVLVIDPHPISLAGLQTILNSYPDLSVIGAATGCASATTAYQELRPDVVVINAHKEADRALDIVRALSSTRSLPAANALVLVTDAPASAEHVLQAGVKGVLSDSSSPEELASAVRIMAAGRSLLIPRARPESEDSPLELLTEREVQVFRLVTRGYSNAEISAELGLSQSTVKSHIQRVMEKFRLRNRVHAVIFAYENNIIRTGT
ncbi:response regulator transcription factor [Kitasatospora purpeofusca]|uniref:response regulator transcription factor n=1 Tax=Kitasatospora purpeofusca TaxID=67352 RepID=UPI0004BFB55D|nr:response regulator transcription factor [Kitasatospora purpeofusca]